MQTIRRWLWLIGGGAIGLVAASPLAAQSPSSTMSREVISATGCLRLASADGRSAETGEGIGPGFILKGVRVAEPPATDTTRRGDAPETRASAPGIAAAEWDSGLLLVADRGINLSEHLGHRILVTGRLASFAAAGGAASASSGRTLTVTTVSMIAPACTTGS